VGAIFEWTDSETCTTAKGKAMLSEQEVEKQEKAFRMTMERTLANGGVHDSHIEELLMTT
jgi:hypothetical protein